MRDIGPVPSKGDQPAAAWSRTVHVGIVTYNSERTISACLASLPGALGEWAGRTTLHLIDNSSADDSFAVARAQELPELAGVEIEVSTTNLGYAVAMNKALAAQQAEYLIALNPDTWLPTGSLERLVFDLEHHPRAALVGPRLIGGDGSPQECAHRFPSPRQALVACFLPGPLRTGSYGREYLLDEAESPRGLVSLDWVIGAVHVLRASSLPPGPIYRERWFIYAEDMDLCWRLREMGYEVMFDSDSVVVHLGSASTAPSFGHDRERMYMQASYDWYRLTHGERALRRWALVNSLGALFHLTRSQLSGRGRSPFALSLRRALPVHLQALVDPTSPGIQAATRPHGQVGPRQAREPGGRWSRPG